MCYRWRAVAVVVCHFKINESNIQTVEEEKWKFVKLLLQLLQWAWNLVLFIKCLSRIQKTTFMWMQDCCKKGIPIDFSRIWEKVKSLCDKLKQKESEGSKAGECNACKGWLDNFRRRFGFKNVKVKEKQLLTHEAAYGFLNSIKKIIAGKGSQPEQVYNVDESALF